MSLPFRLLHSATQHKRLQECYLHSAVIRCNVLNVLAAVMQYSNQLYILWLSKWQYKCNSVHAVNTAFIIQLNQHSEFSLPLLRRLCWKKSKQGMLLRLFYSIIYTEVRRKSGSDGRRTQRCVYCCYYNGYTHRRWFSCFCSCEMCNWLATPLDYKVAVTGTTVSRHRGVESHHNYFLRSLPLWVYMALLLCQCNFHPAATVSVQRM